MAGQPSPASGFNMIAHLKRRFNVGPENWDRYAAAAGGGEVASGLPPPSGAHVTLSDLARDPASVIVLSNEDPDVRAAIDDDGGWIGTPDPTKFASNTAHLSPRELREEIEKGNVMLWKDFKRAVSEMTGEERDVLEALARRLVMQERRFFTLKDGSKVSMWDLFQYVNNNPELEAMVKQGRSFPAVDPEDPAGRLLPSSRRPSLPPGVMTAEEAEERHLDWGHLASGSLWRRRPTRWLRGLDGVKDWDVDVYAHEPLSNQVLGAKYGGRDPYSVVKDPSFARDVLRCGPLLGMTFVMTAARDLSLQDVANTWRDQLSSFLQRQAPLVVPRRLRPTTVDIADLNGATWTRLFLDPSPEDRAAEERAGCDELGVSWRQLEQGEHEESVRAGVRLLQSLPSALCPGPEAASWPLTGTALVDQSGRNLRKGGSLLVTLEPEGGILLQASSSGDGSEKEAYLLSRLEGQEALSGAVMEAFLGPQPVDPDMAAVARSMLLLPANGFTIANRERDPNHPMHSGPVPRLPKLPADPSAFRLTPESELQRDLGGTVVSGIRGAKLAADMRNLVARASAAARQAEVGGSSPSHVRGQVSTDRTRSSTLLESRARAAAIAVLREGLEGMEPQARSLLQREASLVTSPAGGGLMIGPADSCSTEGRLVQDLFSLALRLDDSSELQGAGKP